MQIEKKITLVSSEGILEVKIMVNIFFIMICFLPKKLEKYSPFTGTKWVDLTQRSLGLRTSYWYRDYSPMGCEAL
jgi:hypothetical protein